MTRLSVGEESDRDNSDQGRGGTSHDTSDRAAILDRRSIAAIKNETSCHGKLEGGAYPLERDPKGNHSTNVYPSLCKVTCERENSGTKTRAKTSGACYLKLQSAVQI